MLKVVEGIRLEGKMIKCRRQVLCAVDVRLEFLRNARDLLRTHKGHQRTITGIQKRMFDTPALGRFQDITPRHFPTELGGIKVNRPIDIESRQAKMMHALALHSLYPP